MEIAVHVVTKREFCVVICAPCTKSVHEGTQTRGRPLLLLQYFREMSSAVPCLALMKKELEHSMFGYHPTGINLWLANMQSRNYRHNFESQSQRRGEKTPGIIGMKLCCSLRLLAFLQACDKLFSRTRTGHFFLYGRLGVMQL